MRETEVEDANEFQEEQQEWQGQAKEEHEDDEDGGEEEESVLVQEQEREQEREREEHDKHEQDENDESKESDAEAEAEATDVENEEAQDEADTELSSVSSVASATSRKTNRDEAEEGEEEGNEEPSCLSEAQCCLTEDLDVDLEKDEDGKLKGDKDKKPQLPQLPASPTKLFTSEKSIPQASSCSKSLADDKTAKTFTKQTEGKILHKMSKSEGQNINTAQSRDADTLYKGEFLTIHQGTMEHHEEHATYIQAPTDATDTTTTAHKQQQQQQQPQHTSMTVQTVLTQGPVIIRPTEPLQASSTSRMPQVPPSTPPIETQVQPGAVSVPGIRHGHSYQRTSLASVQSHRPSSTMSSSPSFRSMVPLTATAADFHIHIPDEDHDANAHDEVEACQRNQNGERLLHNAAVLVRATPVSLDEQRRMQQQQQQDHDSDTHQDTSSNPLDKNPHERNHATTRKQRILLSCVLIVLLTVLLPIMIASFMKPKTPTPPMDMSSSSSSTILLQQQQQEAFKKAAIRSPSCPHPTTQNNTCITTMQQFNQAVLDPNTTTVVLCHGTVLDVHSRNGRGMVIRKDDFTLCCAPPPPSPSQDTANKEQDTRIAKSSA